MIEQISIPISIKCLIIDDETTVSISRCIGMKWKKGAKQEMPMAKSLNNQSYPRCSFRTTEFGTRQVQFGEINIIMEKQFSDCTPKKTLS